MNQTNIIFLSGAYENELMFNYDEAVVLSFEDADKKYNAYT